MGGRWHGWSLDAPLVAGFGPVPVGSEVPDARRPGNEADAEFLRRCRERAKEQRRVERERRRRALSL